MKYERVPGAKKSSDWRSRPGKTGHVIAVAQKVYDAEYDKLRDAKVTDFVALLALRRTRERLLGLQKNRRASAANASGRRSVAMIAAAAAAIASVAAPR